jgi:hypothetical protein
MGCWAPLNAGLDTTYTHLGHNDIKHTFRMQYSTS